MMPLRKRDRRAPAGSRGITLLELLVVVAVLGILGGLILPRLVGNSLETKRNACYVNVRNIEVQTELWYRNKGAWPAIDLSDIGSDKAYFPEGLPTCPITKSGYVLDETTHRVLGHKH